MTDRELAMISRMRQHVGKGGWVGVTTRDVEEVGNLAECLDKKLTKADAEIKRLKPVYTAECPTEPGWWWRRKGGCRSVAVEVRKDCLGRLRSEHPGEHSHLYPLSHFCFDDCEWAGPIQPAGEGPREKTMPGRFTKGRR